MWQRPRIRVSVRRHEADRNGRGREPISCRMLTATASSSATSRVWIGASASANTSRALSHVASRMTSMASSEGPEIRGNYQGEPASKHAGASCVRPRRSSAHRLSSGGRSVYIGALHLDVPRPVHRRPERRTGQSRRRRFRLACRERCSRSSRSSAGTRRDWRKMRVASRLGRK